MLSTLFCRYQCLKSASMVEYKSRFQQCPGLAARGGGGGGRTLKKAKRNGIGSRTEDRDCLDSTELLKYSRKRHTHVKNCRLERRSAAPRRHWRILPVHASCGFSEGFRAPPWLRARRRTSCTRSPFVHGRTRLRRRRVSVSRRPWGRACPPRARACLLQASLQHDARHYSGHSSRHGGDVHRRPRRPRRSRRSRPASLRAPPESGFC